MKQILRLAAVCGLAAMTGAVVLSAPMQQGQSISVGGTVSVNVTGEGPDAAVPVTLTVTEPAVVTILASSTDGTDPVFLARDNYGRDLITINDNPSSEAIRSDLDAALDNTLLIPGTYTILVGRNGTAGGGAVDLSILPGEEGVIGTGSIQVIDAAIGAGERYQLPLALNQGELVSLAAIGLGSEFDLRLTLRDSANNAVATNDDNETFDVFLTDLDPRIYQFRVPATETYTLVARPFSGEQSGEFKFVIQRHGVLAGEPRNDVITGETENRARNAFDVDFAAGEIVRITARANNASLDPEIDLLTPDDIFVASNDDHGTEATDLGRFDARIERVIIQQAGTYELDVNSVSGRGEFEVIVERMGVFSPSNFPPIDASAGRAVLPQPEPTIVPEITPEPTSS